MSNQSLSFLAQKLVGFFIIIFLYLVIMFFLSPDIFNDFYILCALTIFFLYLLIEQIYKVEPPKDYKISTQDKIVMLLFFLFPFIFSFSYIERVSFTDQFIPFYNTDLLKMLCLLVLLIGAVITFSSRLILGQFGSSSLFMSDDHRLITTGPFKFIRHPIYLGTLLIYPVVLIIIGSLILTFIFLLFWILMIFNRINVEETMMEEHFGDEYRLYKQKTKRFIPFLY